MYHYSTHKGAIHCFPFRIISCRTLNNFYKLLVIIVICNEKKNIDLVNNVMSKRHGIVTENFIGKTGKVSEFKFGRLSLEMI